MGSQGSQARGAIQVGQDAGATQVSEDLQGFASPLGALRIVAPAGALSQHSGGRGVAHRRKINAFLQKGLSYCSYVIVGKKCQFLCKYKS